MGKLSRHLKEVIEPTWNAAHRCETEKDHYLNAVMGLAGEAGEVLDAHKKSYFHKPRDIREEVLLELGDVMYYWLKLKDLWGFTLDEILEANKKKLFARYDVK